MKPRDPKITAVCDHEGNVSHVEICHPDGTVETHDITHELDSAFPRKKKMERALCAVFIGASKYL